MMSAEERSLDGLVIAVDFDGTCVTHEYPKVGRYIGAEPVLLDLVKAGARLVLFTMRDGKELDDAVSWFGKHSIPLFGVNRHPTQDSWTSSPKAWASLYIDDAALGTRVKRGLTGERPYVDWQWVRRILLPDSVSGKSSGKPSENGEED